MVEKNIVEVDKNDSKTNINDRGAELIKGVKSGISIAIGYIPIAITFGLVAKSSGIPNMVSILMSLLIFAGASQFIGVNLMAHGATGLEIVMTTFILNFRHFLMSSSLTQKIYDKTTKKLLSVLAFGITDETFAVASLCSEERISPWFMLGLNFIAFISWNFGTWIGIFLGDAIPSSLKTSMNIALYAMFIGLLLPAIKESKPVFVVTFIAIFINCLLKWIPLFSFISMGWSIIISTVVAAAIGAVLYPKEVE
ncbi:AzlC family ABC transporter permease [Clostridium ganghwense]|uniref:AzlC family ABC transporter permease n=1 Tax=Clostridium ganghwense TaxID=312089 RepID=A0ABT4CQJ9_9CLOT|nr:AzlC family ABC transporter permease [Clostridium ganghwense]MCY6371330.1 AzlC family ABC transporter permease [Clostridium ganghwense]